jgi:hypothetical protein
MSRLIEEFDFSLCINEMLSVMLVRDTYKIDNVRLVTSAIIEVFTYKYVVAPT